MEGRRSGAPALSSEHELNIIEFVNKHPELYAKEHVHYVDKAKKDAMWGEIGRRLETSGQDVRRWFQSQHMRYSKLTADMRKSGTSKHFQMTERAKWVLHHFKFLDGHIIRRASVDRGSRVVLLM